MDELESKISEFPLAPVQALKAMENGKKMRCDLGCGIEPYQFMHKVNANWLTGIFVFRDGMNFGVNLLDHSKCRWQEVHSEEVKLTFDAISRGRALIKTMAANRKRLQQKIDRIDANLDKLQTPGYDQEYFDFIKKLEEDG